MGGERAGKRKCLLLCLACFMTILLGLEGCISYLEKSSGDQSLALAKSLMSKGEYKASLERSEEILIRYPETHGDQALLLMGQIYAHPWNLDSDYSKSLEYLNRLIREFPKSLLTVEARNWILTIQKLEAKDKEINSLKKQSALRQEELTRKQKEIKSLQIKSDNLQDQIKYLQAETKALYQQIDDLNDQIEKLKEIDLKIEERKRGVLGQ